MTHAMLQGKNLPKFLQAKAINTGVYILNRSPTKAMEGMTPYEAWFKRKPKVDHFKIFGYIAYSHIPKKNQEKLYEKEKNASLLDTVINQKDTISLNLNQSS